MTPAQLLTIKADILANPDLVVAPLGSDGADAIAKKYNAEAVPAFTVWKTSVSIREIGEAMNSTEVGGLTTANSNRLMVMQSYSDGFFNPSRADTRAGFDGVFGGAGGVLTRAALLVLYKRKATRLEKLFALGTGTDPAPATMAFEGLVTYGDIETARNLP